MPATRLYHLARKACIKNIRSITDVGDIPYALIRPILLKLENPEQLHILEEASPQLCGADAELWLEFIKRDIPNWDQKPYEPRNPKNWYRVYRKLRIENQQEVEADAEILRAAMEGIKNERAKHTSKVVDPKTVPRLPRMGGMRVEGGGRPKGNGLTVPANTSHLTFASGSRTKTLTGRGVIDKARREARELSLFSARKSLLATPTHKLSNKATQIRSVPQGLVDEHRRVPIPNYTESSPRITMIIAPRKRVAANEATPSGRITFEDREKRLRAITNPGKPVTPPEAATTKLHITSSRSSPPGSTNPTFPSSSYAAPRMKASTPEPRSRPTVKVKAPADPFMPSKRRKVS